jgi:hypothetical protein
MKSRCLNPNDKSYHRYGGRGITVCDEWLDFANFYKDMYTKWLFMSRIRKNISLDRVNNNGSYCKENCRWATPVQQADNRRSNRILTAHGETQSLKNWARKLGIKRTTITQRLDAYGWSVEKALSVKT